MPRRRRPTPNGLMKEIMIGRRGLGFSVERVQQLNSMPHLLAALGIDGDLEDHDRVFAAQKLLKDFIDSTEGLEPHREMLRYSLNYDSKRNYNRGQRLAEYEQNACVGKQLRASRDEQATSRLIAELLS